MNVIPIVAIYGIGLLPLLVAGIGLWPLRWWQAALLLLGPVLTTLTFIDGSPLQALGWLPVYGIPWAVHLIAPWPVLFATRAWVRTAVPVSVIAVQPLYFATTGAIYLLVYSIMPVLSAGFALLIAWGQRLDGRDKARAAEASADERATAERGTAPDQSFRHQ